MEPKQAVKRQHELGVVVHPCTSEAKSGKFEANLDFIALV